MKPHEFVASSQPGGSDENVRASFTTRMRIVAFRKRQSGGHLRARRRIIRSMLTAAFAGFWGRRFQQTVVADQKSRLGSHWWIGVQRKMWFDWNG
jgi:hypothetical protein